MPREDVQFKPGSPGRPKGARNKLKESFVSAYQRHFREHGLKPSTDYSLRGRPETN